jgi:hypothetical protein
MANGFLEGSALALLKFCYWRDEFLLDRKKFQHIKAVPSELIDLAFAKV